MKHRFLSLLAGFGLLTMASCASNDDVVGHVDIAANEQNSRMERDRGLNSLYGQYQLDGFRYRCHHTSSQHTSRLAQTDYPFG